MSDVASFLKDWHIVILRQPEQALSLIKAIEQKGGMGYAFPTVAIQPIVPSESTLMSWLRAIATADVLFVASQSAIQCAPNPVLIQIAQQKKLKILTMGQATSQAFKDKGLSIFFTLFPGGTSEDLLQQPFLQEAAIKGKKVLLLAGTDGRTQVHDTLSARGASVEWMKVYQQHALQLDLTAICQTWKQQPKIGFIAASINSLKNLMYSLNPQDRDWLFTRPLLTISPRITAYAKECGFQHIFTTKGAATEAMMLGLQRMQEICDTTH